MGAKIAKAWRFISWQNVNSGILGSDNLPAGQRYSDNEVNYCSEQTTQEKRIITQTTVSLLKLVLELSLLWSMRGGSEAIFCKLAMIS